MDFGSDAVTKMFGIWNPHYALHISNPNIWIRRQSMDGYHLRYLIQVNK